MPLLCKITVQIAEESQNVQGELKEKRNTRNMFLQKSGPYKMR